MKKFERSPLAKWVERMEIRVRREEWRARLAEVTARTKKWREEKARRKGRSVSPSGTRQRPEQRARG